MTEQLLKRFYPLSIPQLCRFRDATADAAALNAAKESLAKGYSVSVLAVATVEGAPVRLPDGSLLEDGTGNIAITRLDRVGLTDVARIGGGIYTEITNDSADLARIDSTFASTALVSAGLSSRCLLMKGSFMPRRSPLVILLQAMLIGLFAGFATDLVAQQNNVDSTVNDTAANKVVEAR